jgi:hypothetical protein
MRRYSIESPEERNLGRASDGPVRDRVSSDEAVRIAESLVHTHGVVPSLIALDALMLGEWGRRLGTLTEAEEKQVMRASKFVDHLSDEVLVLRRVNGQEGTPTVLVSLRKFPDADRAFVREHLRPLKALGTGRDRQDALEIPVTRELTRLLAAYDYRVAPWPNQFHSQSNDVIVFGPMGTGRPLRMFNIELRNRRTEVIDRAKDEHVKSIARVPGRGTTMFVVPRCAQRFRREVEELGGVVVETGVYVTTTEEQRDALAGFSWMTLPVELGANAAPRIVEQLAAVILTPDDEMVYAPEEGNATSPDTVDPSADRENESEIRRYLAMRGPQQKTRKAAGAASVERVLEAMELYRLGVPRMADAANIIGCRRQTLVNDFKECGQQSPWPWGGRRPGAGRKSKSP